MKPSRFNAWFGRGWLAARAGAACKHPLEPDEQRRRP